MLLPYWIFVSILKVLDLVVYEKSFEGLLATEENENGQEKGMLRNSRRLIQFCTIQPVIPYVCTKLQTPWLISSKESFNKNGDIESEKNNE